jgi:transcriptional regulator NrdR family protein
MICPDCQKQARVLETRYRDNYKFRKYQCPNKHRFTTHEDIAQTGLSKRTKRATERSIETPPYVVPWLPGLKG